MKLLFVCRLERAARAVRAITRYAEIAGCLGHEVALFGEPHPDFPTVPHSRDVTAFDFTIFIVYEPQDFPDLPYLVHLLDGVPRERRVIIDCNGAYNETVEAGPDSNHLVKLNGHQSWEWIEGFEAVAAKILQPTTAPIRDDVHPFLFFAFDGSAVEHPYGSAGEAVKEWSGRGGARKEYDIVYVGHNWQRWGQIRRFLEGVEPLRDRLGNIHLRGWAWDHRPDWAVEHGFEGLDVDLDFLRRMRVETGETIPFDQVIAFEGRGRFCPVFHRPVFNKLGLVTNRTFETFCADTIPLLMLPESLVKEVHGRDALLLAPGNDVAAWLEDAARRPEPYWDAVLKTRAHLAANHSYQRRFEELARILEA